VERVVARQADGDGIGGEGVHANRAVLASVLAPRAACKVAENAGGHSASHVLLVQALQLLSNAGTTMHISSPVLNFTTRSV